MNRCVFMAVVALTLPATGRAADGAPTPDRSKPQSLKLLTEGHAATRSFRIDAALDGEDVGPGDRPASELVQVGRPDLPREPGAPMKARMSMSLDDGPDAFRPAFSLGGVGAAIMRLTDVLLDQ